MFGKFYYSNTKYVPQNKESVSILNLKKNKLCTLELFLKNSFGN